MECYLGFFPIIKYNKMKQNIFKNVIYRKKRLNRCCTRFITDIISVMNMKPKLLLYLKKMI